MKSIVSLLAVLLGAFLLLASLLIATRSIGQFIAGNISYGLGVLTATAIFAFMGVWLIRQATRMDRLKS